jgi:hypothetical protein
MKRAECEKAIRHLCHQWGRELSASELEHPSFSTFKTWLSQNHYSLYLDFLSTAEPDHDAKMWFDHEFKQNLAPMIDVPRGKYPGKIVGAPPKDEAEHFIKCPACAGWIDLP